MSGGRIGNSNQYLQISGAVTAPVYSFASDNDTGIYRIGANNIGVAAAGAKVLDIATTGLGITGTLTISSTLTYGGVTLTAAVTGTGSMVLSASPTFTGTVSAAAITASGNVTAAAFIPSSATIPTNGMYLGAANQLNFATNSTSRMTLASTGAATFSSTIASGAITSTGAVTGTYFTPTATGTNGLGLTSANRPGLYSTSQKLIDWFTTDNTYITYTGISSSGTGSALVHYNNAQDANGVTYNYYQHSGSNRWRVAYSDSAMDVYSYGAGTNVLSISYSTGAATFSSSVTATKFTATATGTNGLGLAAANTPALYASTTEFMRSTTALTTFALATTHTGATTLSAALTYGGITLSNAVTGTGNMVLSASPTLTGTLTAAAGTFSGTFGATGAATFGSAITGSSTINIGGGSLGSNPALVTLDANGTRYLQIANANVGSSNLTGFRAVTNSAGNDIWMAASSGAHSYAGYGEIGATSGLMFRSGTGAGSPYNFYMGSTLFMIMGTASSLAGGTNNTFDLGTSSVGWRNIYSNNSLNIVSDARLKTDVAEIPSPTKFIMALKPKAYRMVEGEKIRVIDAPAVYIEVDGERVLQSGERAHYEGVPGVRRHHGFLAQDVRDAALSIATKENGMLDANGKLNWAGWGLADKADSDSPQSLRPEMLLPAIVAMLQSLRTEFDEQFRSNGE